MWCPMFRFLKRGAFPIFRGKLFRHLMNSISSSGVPRTRSADLRLAHEQVHVLGHDHVAHESETVLHPHFIERTQELVPCFRRPEPWQSPVTAKREEMQIAATVIALQILWHRGREQPSVRPFGASMEHPTENE